MGYGGISVAQLLIVLTIVVLLFGTKRLRNIGDDLGLAIKNFRNAASDGERRTGSEGLKDAGAARGSREE